MSSSRRALLLDRLSPTVSPPVWPPSHAQGMQDSAGALGAAQEKAPPPPPFRPETPLLPALGQQSSSGAGTPDSIETGSVAPIPPTPTGAGGA